MRKNLYIFIQFCFIAIIPLMASANLSENTPTTISWPFNLGTAGQVATFSGTTAENFSTNHVAIGSNLAYKDASTKYDITYTRFQPATQINTPGPENLVSFNFRMKTGLNFIPTSISFDCMRYGTDGGKIDVIWKNATGSTTIATAVVPARDNSGAGTHFVNNLSDFNITASEGDCSLEIYIYSLGNTKQAGLANVTINGTIGGSAVNVTSYTLNTAVSPTDAGTVASMPVGTQFDEGTDITLTATRNFGYNFSHWADAAGANVSTQNPYNFKLNASTNLTAVFTPINTYSLAINVTGGGKDYMVVPSPAGTMVNNVRMYEDGTTVTIAASNNPILTFTNWASGETNSNLTVDMTQNREVASVYSAVDYIVGWDFYKTGNSGRSADFFSNSDNESASLILRNEAGTATSWLDKSQVAAGGYEGAPAAVNWSPLANKNYYQISFNAKDFTDIKVASAMLFNYNAYSVQRCEYSLNGTDWTQLGLFTMTNAKAWYKEKFNLPATANNAPMVYIRWIPDYTSEVVGTTSTNDGTSISEIFITGTAGIFNDGTAPVLASSVPANGATGASATGKIVLTFDEKIKIKDGTTVPLGTKTLIPAVSGKTITFSYTGLDYNTQYTFTLPANTVADLAENTISSAITIQFTTMERPIVAKNKFNFIVGVDGDFKAALAAAKEASSSGERYYIFFPNGEYNIGANTGDANEMTTIAIPNVSYIGESADGVILYNKSITESINSTATIYFTSASNNIYMQDISLMNKMDYRTGTLKGRGVALWDQGKKNIYKYVKLLSNQDTYYTGSDRSYLENCEIHGTVDFICGGGDIYFNECLLYLEERAGNCLTAPATGGNWGYVFMNCTIDGFAINNNSYRLGRPWSNAPKAVYINTTMKVLPIAAGWGDPMNVVPSVFAEYNSMTASGASVDLANRRTTYTKDATTVTLNPVLTSEQAAQYTIENVIGGTDAWLPQLYTEQVQAPVIALNGSTITWENSNYVLCWAIIKNGVFTEFVTSNSYIIPSGTGSGVAYTVRAANAMGGLGEASNAVTYTVAGTKAETAIAWNTPQSITYGTALSATQLNSSASGNTSTPVYTPVIGTLLIAGTHTLSVTYAEDANYLAATKTVTLVVNKAASSVTWNTPAAITYGTTLSATQLNATTTGTSGTASYTPASGTKLDAGTHTLNVSFAEDTNYLAGTKSVSITVNKASSTATWSNPASIQHGTALSATQLNATVNGTTGAATYTPAIGTVLAVGSHTLSVTFAADKNYEAVTKTVTIEVTPGVAVNEMKESDISIYPNPATNQMVHISMPKFETGATLTIVSMKGDVVLSKTLDSESSNVSLSNISTGTYLFKIQTSEGKITKQVVIK